MVSFLPRAYWRAFRRKKTALRIYRDAKRADVPINVLDIGLIKREMNWSPKVDWQKGMEDAADWLRNFIGAQ
jgi:UDP-glucose 4-epimerase